MFFTHITHLGAEFVIEGLKNLLTSNLSLGIFLVSETFIVVLLALFLKYYNIYNWLSLFTSYVNHAVKLSHSANVILLRQESARTAY